MSQPWVRTAAAIVASILLVPLLLLNAYLLLWFAPEVTAPDGDPGACLWGTIFVLSAASAACLAFGWRRRQADRWWIWLLAAAVLLVAAWPAVNRL